MKFKKLSLWAAAASLGLFAGCNLFNPNGAEESSCDAGNAECYIALGTSLIQNKSHFAAMDAYAKAIAIDSNKSEAYLGYATAATFAYKMNLGSILDDVQAASEDKNPTAFTQHSDAILTLRIKMATAVVNSLGRLAERDSLTRWYEYLTDSTKQSSDPYFAARKAFITNYMDTVSSPSRKIERFPLTDRKKKFEGLAFQYLPHAFMYTILNLYDLEPKGEFDQHDRIMMNLLSPTGDGVGNLTELAEQMKNDTVLQQNVNDKILELQSGLGNIGSLLASVGLGGGDTTGVGAGGGAGDQSKGQIDSAISSLGGSLVFYQFGDRLDNDGDGCIDEEFVDSVDNDLDGFIDEDARLINGNGLPTFHPSFDGPGDGIDNDRNGRIDGSSLNDVGENRFGGSNPSTAADYILNYVAFSEDRQNWVKIKGKADPKIDTRIRIQNDSLAVRLVPRQRPIPAQYQVKLDSAINEVGGCWRNY